MTMISWPPRRWIAAVSGAVALTLAIGIPTAVFPNPLFGRMTPVQWWNYPILAVTAILGGLVIATYVRTPSKAETACPAPPPRQQIHAPQALPTKENR